MSRFEISDKKCTFSLPHRTSTFYYCTVKIDSAHILSSQKTLELFY